MSYSCVSPAMALFAAKDRLHQELLLEHNVNENIFQWILGYPCKLEDLKTLTTTSKSCYMPSLLEIILAIDNEFNTKCSAAVSLELHYM